MESSLVGNMHFVFQKTITQTWKLVVLKSGTDCKFVQNFHRAFGNLHILNFQSFSLEEVFAAVFFSHFE